MLLRRFHGHLRRQDWIAVLLDFLVVVVGLFIGLQIDTWWENRKAGRLELSYLSDLAEDFAANRTRLDESIGEAEDILRSMVTLQQQAVLKQPVLATAILNENMRALQSMPTFFAVDRVYANLTGSGELKLIRSRQLKNALASYYASANVIELVQQTHEMELVQTFQPYLIENLDYAAVSLAGSYRRAEEFALPAPADPDLIVDVLGTREFRNTVTQKWIIASDLLNLYRKQLKQNSEISALIGSDAES